MRTPTFRRRPVAAEVRVVSIPKDVPEQGSSTGDRTDSRPGTPSPRGYWTRTVGEGEPPGPGGAGHTACGRTPGRDAPCAGRRAGPRGRGTPSTTARTCTARPAATCGRRRARHPSPACTVPTRHPWEPLTTRPPVHPRPPAPVGPMLRRRTGPLLGHVCLSGPHPLSLHGARRGYRRPSSPDSLPYPPLRRWKPV